MVTDGPTLGVRFVDEKGTKPKHPFHFWLTTGKKAVMSNLNLIPTAGVGSIREVWGSTPPKTTQCNPPQEIGGLIEGLLTIIC